MAVTEFLDDGFCLFGDMLTDLKVQLCENGKPLDSCVPPQTGPPGWCPSAKLLGVFLEHHADTAPFQHFWRHHKELFPKLDEVCRTTLTR